MARRLLFLCFLLRAKDCWAGVAEPPSTATVCTLVHRNPWAATIRASAAQLAQSSAATHFKVSSWYGRFGNHFNIIRNALEHAICCRATLELPREADLPLMARFLDFSSWKGGGAGGAEASCGPGHTGAGMDFFYWVRNASNQAVERQPITSEPACDVDLYTALEFFLFGNAQPHGCHYEGDHCPPGIEDALVVSIRSGDIFLPVVNPKYMQPPAAFYESVFRQRKWSRILMVTSVEADPSLLNPVWHYFLNSTHWPHPAPLTFQMSTDFVTDLRTLWCSRYFVAASSTLSTFVMEVGPYLKETFVFDTGCDDTDPYVTCSSYTSPTYHLGNWTNSPAQRQAMLEPHHLNVSITHAILV